MRSAQLPSWQQAPGSPSREGTFSPVKAIALCLRLSSEARVPGAGSVAEEPHAGEAVSEASGVLIALAQVFQAWFPLLEKRNGMNPFSVSPPAHTTNLVFSPNHRQWAGKLTLLSFD